MKKFIFTCFPSHLKKYLQVELGSGKIPSFWQSKLFISESMSWHIDMEITRNKIILISKWLFVKPDWEQFVHKEALIIFIARISDHYCESSAVQSTDLLHWNSISICKSFSRSIISKCKWPKYLNKLHFSISSSHTMWRPTFHKPVRMNSHDL